jgi:hypothetical protein
LWQFEQDKSTQTPQNKDDKKYNLYFFEKDKAVWQGGFLAI